MNSAPMTDADTTTLDAFLGGQLLVRQPKRGHRAGHDAILLAAATPARSGDRVVEFGAGVGVAGLALARRVGNVDLVLVEIDPALAALAADNAIANGLQACVTVLDVAAPAAVFAAAGLPPDSVDAVLMNPPFNDADRHPASPVAERDLAHRARPTTLEAWVHAARRILRPGGVLTLIWRADDLAAVLAVMSKGMGSLRLLPLHGVADAPAIRVLVIAIKGGRAPIALCRGFVLDTADPTDALRLLRGETAPAADRS
jgi:tRNA1(Val) A37 N6-methylase TrmN6